MVRSSSERRWQARRAVPRRLADTSRQLARVYAQAMAIHDRLDRVRLDALSGRPYDSEEYDQLILAWRAARRAVVLAERARHGRREAGVPRTPQA